MNDFSQKMRAIAQRLSTYEASGKKDSDDGSPAGFAVCEKLRAPLARLSGVNGFRSLLSRALAVAGTEVRWLRKVHVGEDGTIERPEEMEELDRKEIAAGEVQVTASLLELLATFIGEPLTLSLVREVWPNTAIEEIDFTKDDYTLP